MKKISALIICALLLQTISTQAQTILPDNATLALSRLKQTQSDLAKAPIATGEAKIKQIEKMLAMGVWDRADKLINAAPQTSAYKLLKADYLILHNQYAAAETFVNAVLKTEPKNIKALQLKATLQIQAWLLPQAIATCKSILKISPVSEATSILMGRAMLLQKRYPESLAIAQKIEKQNPKNAAAYQLEADVYFWDQHPEKAEAPLKKSLTIDPYNADARFSYGYAIWRRVDATQLNAMAAQWEIALAVNPLHFSTHWHWGNGHTNLTYADYAQKDDDEVRKVLEKADVLFSDNKVDEAIAYTRTIQQQYPTSVLPLMQRGSIYYSAFDMDRKLRLDSAEQIFKQILARKKHYGPAHNGLSAVIKSQRIPYLSTYDSITNVLNNVKITDMKNFERVFPDVSYYPGNLARAMVWNQMYSAVAYFPFLSKQNRAFKVSPLHIDLAITMRSPSFRYMTTFDNRQWMDIRGVGSGCADMEYVERGAYEERNVVLHEYVHLYHAAVLTDEECRQIRKLYYNAMAQHRTMDYYSQNNESEYFAQVYPAYFEPVKVHPLDFKSMNTTNDLKTKDPEAYAFIDKLVKKQKAYLAGDKSAMADNWAQVYLNLSGGGRRGGSGNFERTQAYLDTSLMYDSKYLPTYLAYARLKIAQKDFIAAVKWFEKAQAINDKYAPIYVARAESLQALPLTYPETKADAFRQQNAYLRMAYSYEDDYQEKASINNQLREVYRRNGLIGDAIATAEEYVKNGATVSTYLRDQRDDAIAYVASLKSELGYPESATVLQKLVEQKPQNYSFRAMYADALAANKEYDKAIATLQQAQRILKAVGNGNAGFDLQIAEFYNALGKKDSVTKYLNPPASNGGMGRGGRGNDTYRNIRLMAASGNAEKALQQIRLLTISTDNAAMAEYHYTNGIVQQANNNDAMAAQSYESAVKANPYLFKVYPWLISYYNKANQAAKADALTAGLKGLKIQPGPGIRI
ncbi:MAG: tetratricopeptide repeat protein [Bacteroidota bacterium]